MIAELTNMELFVASVHGRTQVVRRLLEQGADVNVKNEEGLPAWMRACIHGDVEVARLLVKPPHPRDNGADVNSKIHLKLDAWKLWMILVKFIMVTYDNPGLEVFDACVSEFKLEWLTKQKPYCNPRDPSAREWKLASKLSKPLDKRVDLELVFDSVLMFVELGLPQTSEFSWFAFECIWTPGFLGNLETKGFMSAVTESVDYWAFVAQDLLRRIED